MAVKYQLTSLLTVILFYLKCCAAASLLKSTVTKSPLSHRRQAEASTLNESVTQFDEFDWKLCKLVYNATTDNVLISPISLKLLLAILYEGAGGQTAKEIEKVLHTPSQGKGGQLREKFTQVLNKLEALQESHEYTLLFGTGTFIDKTIKPGDEYNGILKQYYKSKVTQVPFDDPKAVVAEVNKWAEQVTEHNIEKFLDPDDISDDEVLMMANILFFRGLWQKPFDKRKTEPRYFNLTHTTSVKAPFMNIFDDFLYLNATEIDAQILRLPYLGEQFSLYIILPNKKHGLNDVMNKLSLSSLRSYFKQMTETKVAVALPKFSFDSHTLMKPFLQQLEIKDMFSERANLSKISADPRHQQLSVTNILQRTGIEVDEKGSTAYVITEAHLANKFGDSYAEFIADHPFLFTIEHDKARIPVFTGKLANPAKKFSEVDSPKPNSTPVPDKPTTFHPSQPTAPQNMHEAPTTAAAPSPNTDKGHENTNQNAASSTEDGKKH